MINCVLAVLWNDYGDIIHDNMTKYTMLQYYADEWRNVDRSKILNYMDTIRFT